MKVNLTYSSESDKLGVRIFVLGVNNGNNETTGQSRSQHNFAWKAVFVSLAEP